MRVTFAVLTMVWTLSAGAKSIDQLGRLRAVANMAGQPSATNDNEIDSEATTEAGVQLAQPRAGGSDQVFYSHKLFGHLVDDAIGARNSSDAGGDSGTTDSEGTNK